MNSRLLFGILVFFSLSLVYWAVFIQEDISEEQFIAPVHESSKSHLTHLISTSGESSEPLTHSPAAIPPLDASAQLNSAQLMEFSTLTDNQLTILHELFVNNVAPYFQYEFKLEADHKAALQIFVGSMPEGLSKQALDAISEMIRSQLQTAEAEDLALLIATLYQLEQDEAQLMAGGAMPTSMSEQLKMHDQLRKMREARLGKEFASILYASSEPELSRDKLTSTNKQLNQDEEQASEKELAEQELQWEQRYRNYLQEKHLIEKAGLAEQEKQLQIEALLKEHYSVRELEAARAFDRFNRF